MKKTLVNNRKIIKLLLIIFLLIIPFRYSYCQNISISKVFSEIFCSENYNFSHSIYIKSEVDSIICYTNDDTLPQCCKHFFVYDEKTFENILRKKNKLDVFSCDHIEIISENLKVYNFSFSIKFYKKSKLSIGWPESNYKVCFYRKDANCEWQIKYIQYGENKKIFRE